MPTPCGFDSGWMCSGSRAGLLTDIVLVLVAADWPPAVPADSRLAFTTALALPVPPAPARVEVEVEAAAGALFVLLFRTGAVDDIEVDHEKFVGLRCMGT